MSNSTDSSEKPLTPMRIYPRFQQGKEIPSPDIKFPDPTTSSSGIFRKEPIIQEGDIAPVYTQSDLKIPQRLEPAAFLMTSDLPSECMEDDMDLRDGVDYFFAYKQLHSSDVSSGKTYYVVDAGLSHLPGLYDRMLRHHIKPSMVLTEIPEHKRFGKTLKYWSASVAEATNEMRGNEIEGFATLIDCHRKEPVSREHIPTIPLLKSLGVDKVVYLSETPVGKYTATYPTDLERSITDFKGAGFITESFGIDTRHEHRKQVDST